MALSAVDIIALVFILLAAIKLLYLLIDPKKWYGVISGIYKKPKAAFIIYLILAIVVLVYLLQEITIVQIIAVAALVGLLTGMGISLYFRDFLGILKKIYSDKGSLLRKNWVPIIIWLAIFVWALVEIFR